jgi:hypothetical protein
MINSIGPESKLHILIVHPGNMELAAEHNIVIIGGGIIGILKFRSLEQTFADRLLDRV